MALAGLSRLSYRYPDAAAPALDAVDLDVEEGLTVVGGPSGGGKSTLLRVLNGLVPHFHGGRISGRAAVCGLDVFSTPTRLLARKVGFVFQDPELQSVYSVVEREVAFGLENLAVPPSEMAARVEEAMELAGVRHLRGRRIPTLSGGERQRVALASTLALRPRLLVLDEPTSQLDAEGAAWLRRACRELAVGGRGVVVAEQRLEGLAAAADRRLEVEGGRVEAAGATWAPAPAPPPAAGRRRPAAEAWSLRGVAAGFGGRAVLESLELAGGAGEVVALTGPNGGGKTTLLRVLAGLQRPLAGRVERRPGRVAYLPQNPTALLHRPTLLDEVRLTLRRGEDPEPPERVLESLGLLALAGRYPRDLSTGERQRAALAAVLPGSPALVLLDEPTRGMDGFARSALRRHVERLRERGCAIVLATHDRELVAALAGREVRVAGGRGVEVPVAAPAARPPSETTPR